MKQKTIYPLARSKFVLNRNNHEVGVGNHRLFNDEKHNIKFIFSVFIFLLIIVFMAFLIHDLLVFTESVMVELSHSFFNHGDSLHILNFLP